MTLTTHIRFTAPIDPRVVWEWAKEIVHAPAEFEVEHHRRGEPMWETATVVYENHGLRAEPGQGADALIWLEYGAEGSLLNDSEYDDPAIPEDQRPPPAYVELMFDQPYGWASLREDTDRFIAEIGARSLVPCRWWQGECCNEWHRI